jgi:hypothetical protein
MVGCTCGDCGASPRRLKAAAASTAGAPVIFLTCFQKEKVIVITVTFLKSRRVASGRGGFWV